MIGSAGCHKGSMPPFLMAAQAAGCHVSQLVHIGDSISKDLLGALRCGARCVLLTRPTHPLPRADAEVALTPPADGAWWGEAAGLGEASSLIEGWDAAPSPLASPEGPGTAWVAAGKPVPWE
mmetsp:Transcript_15851/g.51235  ORF Transcript_15851/g.51235 Transcript_15851/m.51235 type:complete len:122 (+) Transcript_15851:3-368(+)